MKDSRRTVGAFRIAVLLTCVTLAGTACSSSPSHHLATTSTTQSSGFRSTTTTALSVSSFSFEPCASIIGSPTPHSQMDLRPYLLGAAQLPAGAVIKGPHQTTNTSPRIAASVPTTSPAAYEDVMLNTSTSPGGTATLTLSEVIGDVGSDSFASQLLSMLNADLNGPGCNPNGTDTVPLPGTNPPVSATLSHGQASSGSVQGARLFAAKGPRLLCLTWSSNVAVNASGLSPEPSLPPLPGGTAMAQILNTALNLIPA